MLISQLEQYFDLIVFAAYVEEEDAGSTGTAFATWLMVSSGHIFGQCT
jgi:hypothetical protein